MTTVENDVRAILEQDRSHRRKRTILIAKIGAAFLFLYAVGLAFWGPAHEWWYERAAERDAIAGDVGRVRVDEAMAFLYRHPEVAKAATALTLASGDGYMSSCKGNALKIQALLVYSDIPQMLRQGLYVAQAQCAAQAGEATAAADAYANAIGTSSSAAEGQETSMRYVLYAAIEAKMQHPAVVKALLERVRSTDPATLTKVAFLVHHNPRLTLLAPLQPYLPRVAPR